MHDLDLISEQYSSEMAESWTSEAQGEDELSATRPGPAELTTEDELALASELVAAGNEAELYEAVRKAARAPSRASGKPAPQGKPAATPQPGSRSPRGRGPAPPPRERPIERPAPRERLLERLLVALAHRALPTAVNLVLPGVRGTLSAQFAGAPTGDTEPPPGPGGRGAPPATPSTAGPASADSPDAAAPPSPGEIFGAELEEMSSEDQAFEAAVRFVRFAEDAARELASTPPSTPADVAVKAAATAAAERHAPGLLRETSPAAERPRPRADSGRWVRFRDQIILHDV